MIIYIFAIPTLPTYTDIYHFPCIYNEPRKNNNIKLKDQHTKNTFKIIPFLLAFGNLLFGFRMVNSPYTIGRSFSQREPFVHIPYLYMYINLSRLPYINVNNASQTVLPL